MDPVVRIRKNGVSSRRRNIFAIKIKKYNLEVSIGQRPFEFLLTGWIKNQKYCCG